MKIFCYVRSCIHENIITCIQVSQHTTLLLPTCTRLSPLALYKIVATCIYITVKTCIYKFVTSCIYTSVDTCIYCIRLLTHAHKSLSTPALTSLRPLACIRFLRPANTSLSPLALTCVSRPAYTRWLPPAYVYKMVATFKYTCVITCIHKIIATRI